MDLTGAPVSLTYKNHNTYKTVLGGWITILSWLAVLTYFLVLLNKILLMTSTVTIKSVHKGANIDN